MARKKVEKAPLSPKEAASKEFAMTSCVHSGDPSYRFEVGDSVSIFNAKTNRKPEIIFKTHCAYVTQCGIIR